MCDKLNLFTGQACQVLVSKRKEAAFCMRFEEIKVKANYLPERGAFEGGGDFKRSISFSKSYLVPKFMGKWYVCLTDIAREVRF